MTEPRGPSGPPNRGPRYSGSAGLGRSEGGPCQPSAAAKKLSTGAQWTKGGYGIPFCPRSFDRAVMTVASSAAARAGAAGIARQWSALSLRLVLSPALDISNAKTCKVSRRLGYCPEIHAKISE